MLLTLLFGAIVLLLVYIKRKHFTLRGPIPGSPPYILFGNLVESGVLFNGVTLPQALAQFKKRFGDIFQFWMGISRVIVVGNINDVQHIFNNRHIYDQGELFVEKISVAFPDALICLRGAAHKRHATVISPLFRRANIVSNVDVIIDCTDKLLNIWRKKLSGTVYTDIVQQSENLLLAIFGFIGFDYDLETLNDNSSGCDNELTQELQYKLDISEMISYMPRFLSKIYINLSQRYKRSQTIIYKYLNHMVEKELKVTQEKRAERKRTCLVASLVASLQQDEKTEAMKNEKDQKGLSRSEIFNETIMFLVASFDTTSTALSWFIHLMSKHPEVQQKIKEELMQDNENQQLTLDRLDSFVYLDCVIKEVIRFCPPVPGTVRSLVMDDRLPDSGFQLHKGDQLLIPFHSFAHDTRYWSIDPNLFYPERFLNEDKNHHPYAFIAFGGGHRACIGENLARFELKVIAARLMQHVTFGDGGPMINAGGYRGGVVKPKHIGVTINFDS